MGFSRMLQDAVECHRMQQNLVEYKMCLCHRCCRGLFRLLAGTGRHPCRGSCHHPCVNSWRADKSPVQVQRTLAHTAVWACSGCRCQIYSLIQKPEGFAGRPPRGMCSCPRHISHLTEKGSATWHLILAPRMALSCICRPEQVASRPV